MAVLSNNSDENSTLFWEEIDSMLNRPHESHYRGPEEDFEVGYRTLATVLHVTIFLAGFVGNFGLIFVVRKSKKLHTSTYAYLVSFFFFSFYQILFLRASRLKQVDYKNVKHGMAGNNRRDAESVMSDVTFAGVAVGGGFDRPLYCRAGGDRFSLSGGALAVGRGGMRCVCVLQFFSELMPAVWGTNTLFDISGTDNRKTYMQS